MTLDQTAPRAVRLVALELLEAARRAAGAFRAGEGRDGADTDAEALHDFRVATRRLRSWIRIWRGVLADSLSPKDERRLRRIARATGPARDLDVHLEWLSGQRKAARAAERAGIETVMAALDARRADALEAARRAAEQLEARHDTLAARLSAYRVDVHEPTDTVQTFGAAMGRALVSANEDLASCLARIGCAADHDAIHAARIAAKRLRYLAECGAPWVRGTAGVIADLRALQDLTGSLHDAHVFAEELEARGPTAHAATPTLVRRLEARRARDYAALERRWLGLAAQQFHARVERVAARCARA